MFQSDLNFHIHDPTDKNTAHLLDSMSSPGYTQIMYDPTNTSGHTLDLIFITSNPVKYSHVTEFTWTYHSIIHFSISNPCTTTPKMVDTPYRWWNKISENSWANAHNISTLLAPPTSNSE